MQTRIGIDYTAAVHQSAGIGRYTRELVAALAEQAPGYAFHLFAGEAGSRPAHPLPGPNCTWRHTRISQRWLARLWFRLRLPLPIELWTGPLRLFHATDFFLPPTNPGTRKLVTVHDLSYIHYPEIVMPGMSRLLNTWVPGSIARADHVIAVSEATRQDIITCYNTPADKVSVLYHGVSADFHPAHTPTALAQVREKYNLGDAPFILTVGTIQPRKNYLRLIQAFAMLPRELGVSLVIAGGRGWDNQPLFDEVKRRKLNDQVRFTGFVADADLPALYSAATLFAYPSLYEGFGLPVLEAMACGTPVVTSNTSSLPEVVGQAGIMVSPTDVESMAGSLEQALTDEAQRQRLAAAGKAQAATFNWQHTATQLLELYEGLLS
jgi:glycosyltransferase involved in cell wall biosynthesis